MLQGCLTGWHCTPRLSATSTMISRWYSVKMASALKHGAALKDSTEAFTEINYYQRLATRNICYPFWQLHCLPVCFWVKFKVLIMILKALHNLGLTYLKYHHLQYVPIHQLWSASSHLSAVSPRGVAMAHLALTGSQAFSHHAYGLSEEVREPLGHSLRPSGNTAKPACFSGLFVGIWIGRHLLEEGKRREQFYFCS